MLNGKKVILRAWREEDIPTLTVMRNDVALQQLLMTQPRANSVARTRQWLGDKSSRRDELFFVVARADDQQAIGYVQISRFDVQQGHGYLGICIAPRSQGSGYGHETLELLEEYLVKVFKLRKLMLYVLVSNQPAARFYERAGYRVCGELREHFYMNGDYHGVLLMEKMLRS